MIPIILDPEVNEEADLPTLQRHQQGSRGPDSAHTGHWQSGREERVLRKSAVAHTAPPC